MHIKMVNEIIDYTQNIGSTEDVITALLTTSLAYAPEFMYNLFPKLDIPNIQKDKNDDTYFIDTGFSISADTYNWIKNVNNGINFRPDIMISKSSEWTDETPQKEKLILIESKIWAKLGSDQGEKYKSFKEVCKKVKITDVCTVFISLDEVSISSFKQYFDIATTWNNLIKKAEIAIKEHNNYVEQLLLEEIFNLIKIRLKPEKDDLFKDGKACCKAVLQKMKYRIATYVSNSPTKPKEIYKLYDKSDDNNFLSNLFQKYDLDKKCFMSKLNLEIENIKIEINCAIANDNNLIFWYEKSKKDDENYREYKSISNLDLSKSNWEYEWYQTLYNISEIISINS